MPHIHELIDFTASAYILHPKEPKLLMLKHKKIGKWLQPGGHIELNENPLQTIHHELEEETGLKPDDYEFVDQPDQPAARHDSDRESTLPLPFHLNQHYFDQKHQHIDLTYLLHAKTDRLTDEPDGASDIQWLDISAITELHKAGEMFDATYDICTWVAKKYF